MRARLAALAAIPILALGAALTPATPAAALVYPAGNYSVTGSCTNPSHPCAGHITITSQLNNRRFRAVVDCYYGVYRSGYYAGSLYGGWHYVQGETSNTASCAVFGSSAFVGAMGFQFGTGPTTVTCWQYGIGEAHQGYC